MYDRKLPSIKFQTSLSLIAAALLLIPGCGDSGKVKRYRVSGTITYDGQPVPAGNIHFEPDREKGGSGPSGYATIIDGKYSSKNEGKGAVEGPMKVKILGSESNEPFSKSLFPPYVTTTTISGKGEYDFEIPKEQ